MNGREFLSRAPLGDTLEYITAESEALTPVDVSRRGWISRVTGNRINVGCSTSVGILKRVEDKVLLYGVPDHIANLVGSNNTTVSGGLLWVPI